ncbi:hypothetical protein CB1_002146001, partial [Camelus ferus]
MDMKGCERVEKKQLLASEEKVKLAEGETRQYKTRQAFNNSDGRSGCRGVAAATAWHPLCCCSRVQCAVCGETLCAALAEKKAQDNWLRAQELERENAELRRENAHLKQRLLLMQEDPILSLGHLHLSHPCALCSLAQHHQLLHLEGATEPEIETPEDVPETVEIAPEEVTLPNALTSVDGAQQTNMS